jgi:hypothetical protein
MIERLSTKSDTGAEAAVAVAERGLGAWREAKAAWLEAFAAFPAAQPGAPVA